jgi:hypothetical protein
MVIALLARRLSRREHCRSCRRPGVGFAVAGAFCGAVLSGGGSASGIAPPPPPGFVVTVSIATAGGSVTSTPPGISCPGTCSARFVRPVALTAQADQNWVFGRWGGDCTGTPGLVCTLTGGSDQQVIAIFAPAAEVVVDSLGSGRITSSPDGFDQISGASVRINCSSIAPPVQGEPVRCGAGYPPKTQVTLTATGISGFPLKGWGRYDCPPNPRCRFLVGAPGDSASAIFEGTLIGIAMQGYPGRVDSRPPGISCLPNCLAGFPENSSLTLTASSTDAPFTNWSPPCYVPPPAQPRPVCTIQVDRDTLITAGFGFFRPTTPELNEKAFLRISRGGAGEGTIDATAPREGMRTCSDPTCRYEFRKPQEITLTANPVRSSSEFDTWVGGCPRRRMCPINNRFIDSLAACFRPTRPPHGLANAKAVRQARRRFLIVSLARKLDAITAQVRLTKSRHAPVTFSHVRVQDHSAIKIPLRRVVKRGRYTLTLKTSDSRRCGTVLAATTVKLPA